MSVSSVSQSRAGGAAPLAPIRRQVPFVASMTAGWDLKRLVLGGLAALCFAGAAGFWVLPGSLSDPQAALIKSGLTAVLAAAGASLVQAARALRRPEACFDPVRRELRIWVKAAGRRPHTVLRRRYDTIGSVRLGPRWAEFYEPDGRLLLRLPLADAQARQLLRAHLLGAVPIRS
jgi:hypothetical protein